MRSLIVLAALVLVSGFVLSMAPVGSARPAPTGACVDPKGMYGGTPSCGGLVCVDKDLNGKYEGGECVYFLCPEYGCCACPPPYE